MTVTILEKEINLNNLDEGLTGAGANYTNQLREMRQIILFPSYKEMEKGLDLESEHDKRRSEMGEPLVSI